ncbi:hypothetical protein FOQG_08887 [Fusarium oxysporum f. sp. raphani 54005]|uniref:SGNH hydrolase-type esterase domain-containing protein n=1 Tax=Fusarium oxysporum f. sp. raphani 54005 TaxID=1089458 RepID=X0BZC8_FUSOX|nr:hypothetical protein FOQG_08887 [Fusarium oxysporum f. sp. raphani 54005]
MRILRSGHAAVAIILGLLLCPHTSVSHPTDGISPHGSDNAPDIDRLDVRGHDSRESPSFTNLDPDGVDNLTATVDQTSGLHRRAAKDFYLRVMPLGASITQGYKSSDGNGYRKWLRSQLRFHGWKVNMVGSERDGTMADSDNEGHPGWMINSVFGAWKESKWMKPNLVLINAGLNDCNKGGDPSKAGERTKEMVDDIFASVPGVTVILSTLLRNGDPDRDACSKDISRQIRSVAKGYKKGARIGLADIRDVMKLSDIGPDNDHPTDDGYKWFAGVWWDAISQIEDRIQPPVAVNGINDAATGQTNQCKKVAGNSGLPAQSQLGSGHDDGNYVHTSTARGTLDSAVIDKGSDPKSITDAIPWHIFFANIVKGDPNAARTAALDDWIRVYHNTKDKNAYWFRQNLGGGKFDKSVQFDVDMNCDLGPRYAFADLNNDGLDDFFCIKENAVWASLNRGGNPPKFESIGQIIGDFGGLKATDVRIAVPDIDGDGRADFCLVKSAGEIVCSRNGGWGDKPQWQGFSTVDGIRGTVFDIDLPDKSGIILADINGDFRSDVLYIGGNGNVRTWVNNRGTGKGIVPNWRSAGLTHAGQSSTGVQDSIKFGRIYGSNRLDYILLKEQKDTYDVLVWENKGEGGTKLKADGSYYCDMRNSGSDDLVWIYQDGRVDEINVNIHSPPAWGHAISFDLRVPGPRNGIHLADWTGDGKCDIIVQDKATGALTIYQNTYQTASGRMTFDSNTLHASPGCNQGWGVGIFDLGMRIHDIDGDGRADVLCIEKNGLITGWLNKATGLESVGQVKFSEGWDRASIRFADVEASGRADLLHVDKYTGAVNVFTNNGHKAQGGSSFSWTNRGMLYNPIDRGENMHFTNQGGLGRADMVKLDPSTNKAWTYWNRCGSTGGDDAPADKDPGLPKTGGGSVGDDIKEIDLPEKGVETDKICKMNFDSKDQAKISETWTKSGAAQWFKDFITKNKAENWTDKFFKAVIAGGQQGGSTMDCKDLGSTTCVGPGATACTTYTPPEAFYVHVQISNLFSALHKIWTKSVNFSIDQLSGGIKDIVDKYGEPPSDDRALILNMLVGILTSGAGLGAKAPGISGSLTFLSGAFAQASANSGSFSKVVTKEDLKDDLENAYGKVFGAILNVTNGYVEGVLSGKLPDEIKDTTAEDFVLDNFDQGQWLSEPAVTEAMKTYVEGTHNKWLEFAKTRALMNGNGKIDGWYALMASHPDDECSLRRTEPKDPTDWTQKLTEEVCTKKLPGCIWHDKRCICFGHSDHRYQGGTIRRFGILYNDDFVSEITEMEKVVDDYKAALINNYECNNGEPSVPSQKDLDIKNPIAYPKCFISFYRLKEDERFYCEIAKELW